MMFNDDHQTKLDATLEEMRQTSEFSKAEESARIRLGKSVEYKLIRGLVTNYLG